jgi:hypothetical protein
MKLDRSRSRLAIHTFAEGLFSALAHDLELQAGDLEGDATEDTAELTVKVASIQVSGVMKKGRLDAGVLSRGDREVIEEQIRADVLPGETVTARGGLQGGRASIEVVGPQGRTRVTCDVAVTREGDEKRARGSAEVALSAIGARPVKGPLGAFRVRDRVRVEFDLVFRV